LKFYTEHIDLWQIPTKLSMNH